MATDFNIAVSERFLAPARDGFSHYKVKAQHTVHGTTSPLELAGCHAGGLGRCGVGR